MVQQSADDVVGIARCRRSEHENKRKRPNFMTTKNCRKEEKSKAKTEETRESLLTPPNSAMVDKTGKQTSFLPSIVQARS